MKLGRERIFKSQNSAIQGSVWFLQRAPGYFGDSETDERCGVEVTCKSWAQNLLSEQSVL